MIKSPAQFTFNSATAPHASVNCTKSSICPRYLRTSGCFYHPLSIVLVHRAPKYVKSSFDDHRLVANAGLILPVTLAHHPGLGGLVDEHVDLGDASGRANAGDKMLTPVASALAGGDCIDDADAPRAGRTERVLGCVVTAPATPGTFLRSFRWGHARRLHRVSRRLLSRA